MSELSGTSPSTNPSDGVITPELVLVSPELAEQVRNTLPDRPWEQFAAPRSGAVAVPGPLRLASLRPVMPVEARSVVDAPRQAASVHPDERLVAARPCVRWAPPETGRFRRPRGWGRLAMVASLAALCLAALVWASDRTPRPSLLPAEASAPVRTPKPARRAKKGATALRAATRTTTRPAPPKSRRAAVTLGPLPRGGYVFDGGLLVGDPSGHTVTLRFLRGCLADHSTPALRVISGRFRYDGPVSGNDVGVRLHVAGRFAGRERVRVTVAVAGATCHLPARTLTATLT